MLMILPIGAFVLFFLVIWTSPSEGASPDWRKAFLQAAMLWGATLVAIMEGLGLGHALTAGWVAAGWSAAAIAAAGWGIFSVGIAVRLQRVKRSRLSLDWASGCILVAMGAIVICLFVVAWVAPTNNTDSLQYHMSRVVHWAQDRSLAPYPTAFEPQLINPIGAELAILNLRMLWGSDALANLVQWSSMVGSLIVGSMIARELGASRRGQLVTLSFMLSIPMGVLQSTSTQNDYVVAFLTLALAYHAVIASERALSPGEWMSGATALGLGMLTKGTFYPYALPFLLWILIRQTKHLGWKRMLLKASGLVAVAVLLNLGYWLRNMSAFGTPLGPTTWIENRTASNHSPMAMVAAIAENSLLNFATPYDTVNRSLAEKMQTISTWLGLAPHGFALTWSWNHEDLAGNPLQFGLIPVTAILLALGSSRGLTSRPRTSAYAICSLATFVMLGAVVAFDIYGLRYQLPFLVSWAPMVGVAAERLRPRRLAAIASIALIATAVPYALLNRSRPLIAVRPGTAFFSAVMMLPTAWRPSTMTGSILNSLPIDIFFANNESQGASLELATNEVETLGCRDVGLRIDSHDPEYAFWWLLKAPQSGVRIEVVDPTPATERYQDPSFKPCAVICTICGGRARLHGMPVTGTFGSVTLFAGDGFTWDKDG